MKRICLWPDSHINYQHKRAFANMLQLVSDQKFDEVLFLGDLYDFKPVARWSKDTADEKGEDMQKEADAGHKFFTEFRQAHSGLATITLGNHEARWNNYLMKYAPGILGMDDLKIEKVFHFDEFDIKIKPQPYKVAPNVIAIHGTRLGPRAGMSAYKELSRFGSSVVMGHCHRLGVTYHTTEKRRFALEAGWLGDIKQASYLDYGVGDWQMGFATLQVEGNLAVPSVFPIEHNGSFIFEGKRYA